MHRDPRGGALLLIQFIDREQRVGADVSSHPVPETAAGTAAVPGLRCIKCGPHRRRIDRRVICPQGPNQSLSVHRSGVC